MRQPILVLAALVLMVAPIAGAAHEAVAFTGSSKSGAEFTVDLIADRDQVLHFTAADSAFTLPGGPSAVTVFLTCDCAGQDNIEDEEISLGMSRSGGVWSADLAVNHVDLVKGTWNVVVVGASGGQQEVVGPHTVVVTAADTIAPDIVIDGLSKTESYVALGANRFVQIEVRNETLLRSVSYRLPGMPAPVVLQPGSMTLPVTSFKPGSQVLDIRAVDRAGNSATRNLTVFADDVRPVVNLTVPAKLYLNVPNPIRFTIAEHSPYVATVSIGETVATFTDVATNGKEARTMAFTPVAAGDHVVKFEWEDALGNRVEESHAIRVQALETDLRLVSAKAGPERVLPGEPINIIINATQSVSPVAVEADVRYGGNPIGRIVIAAHGFTNTTLPALIAPGQHSLVLSLHVPAGVIELNQTNQAFVVPLEVFAGKVVFGDIETFYIRADARGLPTHAVADSGEIYPVKAKDQDLRLVYAFAYGDIELFWDPSESVTLLDPADFEKDGPKDGNGIPALPVMPLLLALAAIGFLRRRA